MKAPHSSFWGIYPAIVWVIAGVIMIAKGPHVGIYGGDVGAGEVIAGIGVVWILVWFFLAYKNSN